MRLKATTFLKGVGGGGGVTRPNDWEPLDR